MRFKLFFYTIPFLLYMKDNSRIKFQWNWPKLETEKWWLLAQKNKNIKKTMYLLMKLSGIWNWKKWSYLCGIWSVSKITFEQFQNQKNPGIFEKWQTFFRLFFFSVHFIFFFPKSQKKTFFDTQFLSKKYVLEAVIRFLIIWLKLFAVSDQFQKKDLKLFETVKVSLKLAGKKKPFRQKTR